MLHFVCWELLKCKLQLEVCIKVAVYYKCRDR